MVQQVVPITEQPPKLPALQAGGVVRAIVPQDFDSAWRIARAVTQAGMAPNGLDTPERAMVAILHGLEIGMTPMAALQSIAVINGRPTLWGDGALGVVRASGLLESFEETITDKGNGELEAVCRVKRKGDATVIERTFSTADARAAGLLNKKGPWQEYRKRMLGMRARAWALRDGFADVLKGLGIREEVEDIPARNVTPAGGPPPVPPPPASAAPLPPHDPETGEIWDDPPAAGPAADGPPPVPPPPAANAEPKLTLEVDPDRFVKVAAKPAQAATDAPSAAPPPAPEPELFPPDAQWLRDLEGAFGGAEDSVSLGTEWVRLALPQKGKVPAETWQRAISLFREHAARLANQITG